MKWMRYLVGSFLAFLVFGTVSMMVSGFILLDIWGAMEANGVLRPAQGGNNQIIMSIILLFLGSFLITFIYIRLKKAENPLIFGPVMGMIYSMMTIGSYFLYQIPSSKVPAYLVFQNVVGITLGIWVFRHTYYKK